MSSEKPSLPRDADAEISALIETLHNTEQRLEGLTAGEVDTVANREGRTFLLRRAQELLRHSEADKQAAILNALPAHIALLDAQGVIISVNETWLRLPCADAVQGPGHRIGLNYLEICDGTGSSDADQIADGIRSVLGGEAKSFSFEYPCHSATKQRWFLLTATPLADDRPNGAIVMHVDVTAERRAEESLRASELRFRQMAENIRDVFFLQNLDSSQIYYVSPAYEQIWGRTCESLYANPRSWADSIHPDDLALAFTTLNEGRNTGFDYECRIVRPDGEIRWIHVRGFPILDDAGNPYRTAGVASDITQRKQASDELHESVTAQRQIEAQLRQSQKMEAVGQLAAGVAHEFNNLLQALMSKAAIMRLRAGTAEFAAIGTEMEVQIKRGAAITKQLLLFSRSHTAEKTHLDLRVKIQEVSVLLRQLISENIRVVIETSPELLSVEGDPGQMQQVLLNLAINARDAMPAGGTLTLRAGSCGDEVFLEIEDSGHGMDEATRAHIFEPFFTTKEIGKGTGLGLAVVYGIVEQHGGRIEVHSSPGQGSRFRVILPTASSESDSVPERRDDAAVPVGSGRVLLVEDEEGVREGIGSLLAMIGYEVTAVSTGEEAIAIPLHPAPDLLLSDVTLPGIAGLALGERLRERWPSLKVVLMSGYIEEALRADANARGWHFLQKPFEMTDLASHLRAALDGKPLSELATKDRLIA